MKQKLRDAIDLGRRFRWFIGACIVIFVLIFANYRFQWTWAGFNKSLWDWMQLLIIPLALAVIAILFNRADRKNEQKIASDNQQEAALQSYLDRLSELQLKENLRKLEPDAEAWNIARSRTLTVLRGLDPNRKGSVLRFLSESGLISIIDLSGADLVGAELSEVKLEEAKLTSAKLSNSNLLGAGLKGTNLRGADLSGAILVDADLRGANLTTAKLKGARLSEAVLNEADLSFADPSYTDLSGATVSANTSRGDKVTTHIAGANLTKANLTQANLYEANLKGTCPFGANLHGANLTKTNLKEAYLRDTDLTDAIYTIEPLNKVAQGDADLDVT